MWFKQAQFYRFGGKFSLNANKLEEKLEALAFTSCLSHLPSSQGWASPIDKDNAPLVHAIPGFMLICLQTEEKLLPATIIRQKVSERVKELEANSSKKVSAKDKRSLRQEIYNKLLPKAFGKVLRQYAFIDVKNSRLILDTANPAKAKNFVDFFKRTLGDKDIYSHETKKISSILTNWLMDNSHPDALQVEDSCVFFDPSQQRRSIRIQNQDLAANCIRSLTKEGFEVLQLKLSWNDQITFTLKNDFTLQSVKYQEPVISLANEIETETKEERFDADFVIMSGILVQLFKELKAVLSK